MTNPMQSISNRPDSELIAAFHGLETVFDAKANANVHMAMVEQRDGTTRLVGVTELMEIQANFSFVSERNTESARHGLLKAEDAVVFTASRALEKANEGPNKNAVYSTETISKGSRAQVKSLLASFMSPKAGG